MAFFEIEIFCPSNDTVKEMKRQATDWKKIFAKCIADNGLLSEIHIKVLKLKNKKTIRLKNGPKNLHRYLTKEDLQ